MIINLSCLKSETLSGCSKEVKNLTQELLNDTVDTDPFSPLRERGLTPTGLGFSTPPAANSSPTEELENFSPGIEETTTHKPPFKTGPLIEEITAHEIPSTTGPSTEESMAYEVPAASKELENLPTERLHRRVRFANDPSSDIENRPPERPQRRVRFIDDTSSTEDVEIYHVTTRRRCDEKEPAFLPHEEELTCSFSEEDSSSEDERQPRFSL